MRGFLREFSRLLLVDFPAGGRGERLRFQRATDLLNARRARVFGILLIAFFSLFLVADLFYFLPRGRDYYLLYDLIMVTVTAAFLIPHYRLSPGPLLRLLTTVFVYFMLLWGAFLSAVQGSAVTYLIILFVVASVFYQRWFLSLGMFFAGALFYLVPATLFRPESLESILLIEIVGAGIWSWVVTRILYRAHLVNFEQGSRIRSITRNQRRLIDERSAELAEKVRERDILLGELNHRIKNNLQLLSSLLSLSLRDGGTGPEELVRESVNRIRSMSTVHEMLYAGEDLSAVDLSSYLSRLTAEVVRSFDPGGRMRLEMEFEQARVGTDLAVSLGLLVNELITNCFKHAFPLDGDGGRLRMLLGRKRDGRLRLVMEDDGVGIGTGYAPGGGKERPGFLLLDALARQAGGELKVESPLSAAGGTRVTVELRT